MENNLKAHSSWSQMRAVEQASERVQSWPEWKRTALTYRQSPREQTIPSRNEPVDEESTELRRK